MLTMRTAIPDTILKIIQRLETRGKTALTRLPVLKKWLAGFHVAGDRNPNHPRLDRLRAPIGQIPGGN